MITFISAKRRERLGSLLAITNQQLTMGEYCFAEG